MAKHWADFPGSQAAAWEGRLVDMVGESDNVFIETWDPADSFIPIGRVFAFHVKPIGPVARELLKVKR